MTGKETIMKEEKKTYDKRKQLEEMKKGALRRLKTECHETGISYIFLAASYDDGITTEWYADGIPAGEIKGLRLSDDRVRRAICVLRGLDDIANM